MRDYAGSPRGIALAADVDIDVSIDLGEPVLVNDADVAATVTSALVSAGLTEEPALRSCGSDDFAYYCELRPLDHDLRPHRRGWPLRHPGLHHPAFTPADAMVRKLAEVSLVTPDSPR